MEPFDDHELRVLLRAWKAPGAPTSLRPPVPPRRAEADRAGVLAMVRRAVRWLATGTIRIPAPIGVAALIVLALWAYGRTPREVVTVPASGPVALDDFQPVARLQPRIVGEP